MSRRTQNEVRKSLNLACDSVRVNGAREEIVGCEFVSTSRRYDRISAFGLRKGNYGKANDESGSIGRSREAGSQGYPKT